MPVSAIAWLGPRAVLPKTSTPGVKTPSASWRHWKDDRRRTNPFGSRRMISVRQAVYRLKRVPPRRLPEVVGRFAWREARARARRWHIEHNRGELSDAH